METITERNARKAAEAFRRMQHTMRADFWAGKAASYEEAQSLPMGKLEREAAAYRGNVSIAQADWHNRYLEACQPVRFTLINGGRV